MFSLMNLGLLFLFGAIFWWLYDFVASYPSIQKELYELSKND